MEPAVNRRKLICNLFDSLTLPKESNSPGGAARLVEASWVDSWSGHVLRLGFEPPLPPSPTDAGGNQRMFLFQINKGKKKRVKAGFSALAERQIPHSWIPFPIPYSAFLKLPRSPLLQVDTPVGSALL